MAVRKCKRALTGFLFVLALPGLLQSHPGGLDGSDGHQNRKTDEYHYHQKRVADSLANRAPTAQLSTISPAVREKRINEYFRLANENVGALSCNLVIYDRDVPGSVKEDVRHRDGDRCVICGSTDQLEVDHKRALMNGGGNSHANLATLCDDCHTEKTRMDNSLRRKREKLCRNSEAGRGAW
jgi:hypothetical protein